MSVKKHFSGEEDTGTNWLSKHPIRGWRAVSAAILHGHGSRKITSSFTYTSSGSGGVAKTVCHMSEATRLTPTGKQVLKRICKGKRPHGLKAWPDKEYNFPVCKGALACRTRLFACAPEKTCLQPPSLARATGLERRRQELLLSEGIYNIVHIYIYIYIYTYVAGWLWLGNPANHCPLCVNSSKPVPITRKIWHLLRYRMLRLVSKSPIWKSGPSPWEILIFKGHVEATISSGFGI